MVVGLVVFHRVVLYMTTGSVVYQDYEFYSTANAARRLYPEYYTADGHYTEAAVAALQSDTCPAPANHTNPMPVINITPAADEITHLHIVVAPNSWTLFPWLWDSILINQHLVRPHTHPHPHPSAHPPTTATSAPTPSPPPPRATSTSQPTAWPSTWSAGPSTGGCWAVCGRCCCVGEWWMERGMYEWLRDEEVMRELHPEFYLMTLLLMGEECLNWNRNWTALQAEFHPRLAAMFTTYGDCHLNPAYDQLREVELPNKQPIDMGQNIVYWPLGPSVEHGFPSRWLPEEEDDHSAERQRDLLLNLMVSITWEKSTRMQAWMVTTGVLPAAQRHSMLQPQQRPHLEGRSPPSTTTSAPPSAPSYPSRTPLTPSTSHYYRTPPTPSAQLARTPNNTAYGRRSCPGSIPIIENPTPAPLHPSPCHAPVLRPHLPLHQLGHTQSTEEVQRASAVCGGLAGARSGAGGGAGVVERRRRVEGLVQRAEGRVEA